MRALLASTTPHYGYRNIPLEGFEGALRQRVLQPFRGAWAGDPVGRHDEPRARRCGRSRRWGMPKSIGTGGGTSAAVGGGVQSSGAEYRWVLG